MESLSYFISNHFIKYSGESKYEYTLSLMEFAHRTNRLGLHFKLQFLIHKMNKKKITVVCLYVYRIIGGITQIQSSQLILAKVS